MSLQVCAGDGLADVDPRSLARLELPLVELAPRLVALDIMLRSEVLPALPWLGASVAERLQKDMPRTVKLAGE